MILPSLKNTLVSDDAYEWSPKTFPDFLVELQNLKNLIPDCCYFRGQRLSNRLLDSTFARKMKERRGLKDIERYSLEQQSNIALQHELANELLIYLHAVPVLEDFLSEFAFPLKIEGHIIDMLFQYHIHVQQNPKDPNLINFTSLGTNFLDFSLNWKIGLFFANRNRLYSDAGALFMVRQMNLGPVLYKGDTPFRDILFKLKRSLIQGKHQEYSGLPLLPWPEIQLNNTLDPKPKRQEAVYIAQMDFRKDLETSWKELYLQAQKQVYVKLVIPPNTSYEVQEYLTSHKITEEFLFPITNFDKIN